MKEPILVLHNQYKYRGGEDTVIDQDIDLLQQHGHYVVYHTENNSEILDKGKIATIRALAISTWSRKSYETVRKLCQQLRPQIVHVHNFWFRLTPSIFAACHDEGVPVVLTLHNFRILCAAGVMLHNDKPCNECVTNLPWRGVWRRCYHDSFAASLAVTKMITSAKRQKIWHRFVDIFTTPSKWARNMFIKGGLPQENIIACPHFVADPGSANENISDNADKPPSVVYLGRLSEEKGLPCLIDAWNHANLPQDATLTLAGNGSLFHSIQKLSGKSTHPIQLLGAIPRKEALALLRNAAVLVLPSQCYETFGLSIIEAFSHKVPVIASRIGAFKEIIEHGKTGLLFDPGDKETLAALLSTLLHDTKLQKKMGANARQTYLKYYTPNQHYVDLMNIYEQAQTVFRNRTHL